MNFIEPPPLDIQPINTVAPVRAYPNQQHYAPAVNSIYDGAKYPGGFGITQLYEMDYWTLRQRSNQLFTENLYARGIISRFITNEVNSGQVLEAFPEEDVLGVEEGTLDDWSELIESQFTIWGSDAKLCDWEEQKTFGELQQDARMQALVDGDVLVMIHQNPRTKLPQVQLIRGEWVRNPITGATINPNHRIVWGVELDKRGRQVAFHVQKPLGQIGIFESIRIPAFGARTGRRIAWLMYGTQRRKDHVRGEPILSILLQSLKELDHYRDAAQRKAVLGSLMALQVTKKEQLPGTLPLTGGAVQQGAVTVPQPASSDNSDKAFKYGSYLPGMMFDELQTGEEIKPISNDATDINYPAFETGMVRAMAWALEIPPEILEQSFSSNYSASQAAINEYKQTLNKHRVGLGVALCSPVYQEWLINMALLGNTNMPGFLEAWRSNNWLTFGAWIQADWYGSIKPSTDLIKSVKSSDLMVASGFSTRAREARGLNGSKYRRNIRLLQRENEQLVAARRPIAEFEQEFGTQPPDVSINALTEDAIEDKITEQLDDRELHVV